MSMTMTMPFDTLAFANKLKNAGVDSKIAEAQAEIQAQVMQDFADQRLATKEDIREIKIEIAQLDTKIEQLRVELTLKLGGIIVASTAVLGTLITVLSHLH